MGFDISILGDKELSRKLDALPKNVQRKLLGRALKLGGKLLKPKVVAAVPVDTGLLKQMMQKQNFKAVKANRRGDIRIGMPMPTREQMGIGPDEKYYYPAHVEYGHGNVPAKSYIRKPVDENAQMFHAEVGRALGAEIEAEAKKK